MRRPQAALLTMLVAASCARPAGPAPAPEVPPTALAPGTGESMVVQERELPEDFEPVASFAVRPSPVLDRFGSEPSVRARVSQVLTNVYERSALNGDDAVYSRVYVFSGQPIDDIYASFAAAQALEEIEELPEEPPGEAAQMSYEHYGAEAENETYQYLFLQRNVLGQVSISGPNGAYEPADVTAMAAHMVAHIEEAAAAQPNPSATPTAP